MHPYDCERDIAPFRTAAPARPVGQLIGTLRDLGDRYTEIAAKLRMSPAGAALALARVEGDFHVLLTLVAAGDPNPWRSPLYRPVRAIDADLPF